MNDQIRDDDHDYAPTDKCAAARFGFHAKTTPSPRPRLRVFQCRSLWILWLPAPLFLSLSLSLLV